MRQIYSSTSKINNMQFTGTAALVSVITYVAYIQASNFAPHHIPHATQSHKKAIIFDLDGVLCSTNKIRAFHEIGIATILQYIYDQKQLPSEKKLYDILAQVPAMSTYQAFNKNLRIPQIMVDWQTGAQDVQTIRQAITQCLKTLNLPEIQKSWALQTALMMTDPAKFIATRQIISENIQMLHELKEQGYQLYVLSNWDPNSFPLFKAQFPEIFMYQGKEIFDGIMTSGQAGIPKPEIALFAAFLKKFNLKSQDVVFIDDEPANVLGAQTAGITSILADPDDTQAVRANLVAAIL